MYGRQGHVIHHVHGFGHVPRNQHAPQALCFSSLIVIPCPLPISSWRLRCEQQHTATLKSCCQAQDGRKQQHPCNRLPPTHAHRIRCPSTVLLPAPPLNPASGKACSTATLTCLPTVLPSRRQRIQDCIHRLFCETA